RVESGATRGDEVPHARSRASSTPRAKNVDGPCRGTQGNDQCLVCAMGKTKAARQIIAVAAWHDAQGDLRAGLHQAVDDLLDRPVPAHRDHPIVAAIDGVQGQLASMAGNSGLEHPRAWAGGPESLLQPRLQAYRTTLARRGVDDQQGRPGGRHAADCALAVNVADRRSPVAWEIWRLTH